jgi:hypothetical protein
MKTAATRRMGVKRRGSTWFVRLELLGLARRTANTTQNMPKLRKANPIRNDSIHEDCNLAAINAQRASSELYITEAREYSFPVLLLNITRLLQNPGKPAYRKSSK